MSSRCDRLRGAVTASGVRPDQCSHFLEFKRIALRSWGLGFPAQWRTVSGLFIWCQWNVALLTSGILVLDSRFVAAEGFEVSVPSQLVRFVRLFKQSASLQIIRLSAVEAVCVADFALFLTFRCLNVKILQTVQKRIDLNVFNEENQDVRRDEVKTRQLRSVDGIFIRDSGQWLLRRDNKRASNCQFYKPLCAFTQRHHQGHVSLSLRLVASVTSFLWRWDRKKTNLIVEPGWGGSVESPGPPDVWTQLSPVTLVTTGRRSVAAAWPPQQGWRAVRSAVEWGGMWSHTPATYCMRSHSRFHHFTPYTMRTTQHCDESVSSEVKTGNTSVNSFITEIWLQPPDRVICRSLSCL